MKQNNNELCREKRGRIYITHIIVELAVITTAFALFSPRDFALAAGGK